MQVIITQMAGQCFLGNRTYTLPRQDFADPDFPCEWSVSDEGHNVAVYIYLDGSMFVTYNITGGTMLWGANLGLSYDCSQFSNFSPPLQSGTCGANGVARVTAL